MEVAALLNNFERVNRGYLLPSGGEPTPARYFQKHTESMHDRSDGKVRLCISCVVARVVES